MSQVYCPKCKCLCRRKVGERCPSTLTCAENWRCDGILVEHQCGGPSEACGIRECEECHPPPKQEPQRDALWCAIYAAEFVRRVADAARRDEMTDEMMAREGEEAKALADWHHEAVPEAER